MTSTQLIMKYREQLTDIGEKVVSLERQNEELRKQLESPKCSTEQSKNSFTEKDYQACKMKNNELQVQLKKTVNMLNWYKVKSMEVELDKKELKNKNVDIASASNETTLEIIELKKKLKECNLNLYECQYNCKSLTQECDEFKIQNAKLENELQVKTKELQGTKSLLAKYIEDSKSVEVERDTFELITGEAQTLLEMKLRDISAIKEDAEKRKEEYKSLDMQYKTLQISNFETKEELAKEIVSRKLLASELKKKKAEIKKYQNDIASHERHLKDCDKKFGKLEKKLQNYMSNEIIQKIRQIIDDLDTLHKNGIQTRDKLAEEVKIYNRSLHKSTLEDFRSEYAKQEKDLRKRGLTVSKRTFLEKFQKYENVCAEHDVQWKDIVKQAYEMPKLIKYVEDKMKKDTSKHISDITATVDELKQNMNVLREKTLKNDFDEEKRIYKEVINAAKEEISYRWRILRVTDEINAITGSSSTKDLTTSDEENGEYKTLNNGEHVNLKRWNSEFSLASNRELNNSDTSIILFNLPESKSEHEDVQMVKMFLIPHNLNSEDYKVKRLGKVKPDKSARPIVVTFTDLETVNKILQYENGSRYFNGCRVGIRKFEPRNK